MALDFKMTMPDPMHQKFLAKNTQIFPRLSTSPDLDPDKHTRNKLERRVQARVSAQPANVHDLFQALKWE